MKSIRLGEKHWLKAGVRLHDESLNVFFIGMIWILGNGVYAFE